MDFQRITEVERKVLRHLNSRKKDLLAKCPLEKYIYYLENSPLMVNYKHISREIEKYCNEIISYSDETTLDLYHRLILVTLIAKSREKLENKKVPMITKSAYIEYFNKILRDIDADKNPVGFYLYPKDSFEKDLGVCRLKLIPASHHLLELTNLSKRFLFKGGMKQFIRGVFIVLELGGFARLLEEHIDSRPDSISLSHFSPGGWNQFYLITAEILKLNPEIKGTFGTSWYYYPKIGKISPKLAYIIETGKQYGREYFYIGTNEHCIKDATFKSPTRRKLFEEGKYFPTDYLGIVPRRRLLRAVSK